MLTTFPRSRTLFRSLPRILSSISPVPNHHFTSSSSRRRNSDESSDESGEDDSGVSVLDRDGNSCSPPKLFVVQPRVRPDRLLQAKLSEALNLANSLNDRMDRNYAEESGEKRSPPHLVVQNPMARSKGRADKFFGPGTVENVKCHLQALDSEVGPDGIFVNAILSGIQQRNLENAWGKPVLDRIGLIIEIFNSHAQTKEAKLQSELAALMYKSTRLVRVRGPRGRLTFGTSSEAEVVSAKGKGSGGCGFLSGAGESEIQLQRRRIQERREHLLYEIEEVRRTRALQRYARRRRGGSLGQGLPIVAVVGYTNAGKSTLVSALSQSDLYRDDRLFATVDPRLRSVILPSGRKALLSDTVGFISDLPVQLVEAFHATLEEVIDADLLVHVLDSSATNLDEQCSTVLQVLKQIGVSEEKIQNMIEVWNKIDILNRESGAYVTPAHGGDVANSVVSGQDNNLLRQSPRMHIVEDGLEKDQNGNAEMPVSHCGYTENEDAGIHIESMCTAGAQLLSGEPAEEEDLYSEDMKDNEEVADYSEDVGIYSQLVHGKSTGNDDPSSRRPHETRPLEVGLATCQLKDVQRVETSAVMGVGLQELLYIIDRKLDTQKTLKKENANEIFNRKWRPSHAKDGEMEAV